jgi:hypothetical protein
MVIHPELFIDQMGHPRAGPKPRFISQGFRPLKEPLLELV